MIIVRMINLPVGTKAWTTEDSEGDYNVYINANISLAEQEQAYKHELYHIEHNHFRNNEDEDIFENNESDARKHSTE